jgi:CheY-like chemotaxis protein
LGKKVDKNEEKSIEEFLGNLSFDILTTIGGISALVETGIDDLVLTKEQREYFEIIQECSASLIKSHDELLAFFKIQRMNSEKKAKTAEQNDRFSAIVNKKLNILLVEDEPINRKILSRRLGELGHNVISTAFGEEAMVMHEKGDFDLIFLDLQLKDGVYGTEVSRTIRASKKDIDKRIPIVALTASILEETQENCESSGIDKILTKPVYFKDIMDILGSF